MEELIRQHDILSDQRNTISMQSRQKKHHTQPLPLDEASALEPTAQAVEDGVHGN